MKTKRTSDRLIVALLSGIPMKKIPYTRTILTALNFADFYSEILSQKNKKSKKQKLAKLHKKGKAYIKRKDYKFVYYKDELYVFKISKKRQE